MDQEASRHHKAQMEEETRFEKLLDPHHFVLRYG
jgi:hypothetical protein